ncbi:hypothetical protein VNI00_017898 [Paramarasmius palmivorus]|uniref:Uncharacterized protein n=1 Tax=Paramarasmius palmivorus TaxID=297713 RepID=A0AAW0B2U2_9AGAR
MATVELSPEDAYRLFKVVLPCHEEFFVRVVDAYPRLESGLLGTLFVPLNEGMRQLELMMLYHLADFCLHIQRKFAQQPVLTARFKANVELLNRSLDDVCPDMNTEYRASVLSSESGTVAESDFTLVSNTHLWAAALVRAQDELDFRLDEEEEEDIIRYVTFTVNWIRTTLGELLGVRVLSGDALEFAASTLYLSRYTPE